jgi:hypothetical protein
MKKTAWILLLIFFSCSQKPKPPAVHISLVNDNKSIRFNGLDNAIVSEINRDTIPGIWENLVPVFKMPADTDVKNYQPVQHGLYTLKDSSVIFTPDTPFVKGQTYFMRYYIFKGENMWDYIKGKKRLGEVAYRDLVVKP